MAQRIVKNQKGNEFQRQHVNTGYMSNLRAGLTIAIDEKGLDEMIAKLQTFARIGDTDAKRVRSGMGQTVRLVEKRAEVRVPVRTGQMKKTLFGTTKTWGEGNVTGNVGSDARELPGSKALAPFVLEGGRKGRTGQAIRSTTEYEPQKEGSRRKIRKKLGYGNVGAIIPRRWLYHSYEDVKDKIDRVWERVIDLIMKDLAGKG